MTPVVILVSVAIAVGLVGVIVPLLPGSLLVAIAIAVWAVALGEAGSWVVLAICLALIGTGVVVKYLVPGRQLQRSGVPNRTLLIGAAVGIVGFFVVPVIGLPLGFVAGVYGAEWQRRSRPEAWPATVNALRAIGLGILIELGFTTLAALTWALGAIVT